MTTAIQLSEKPAIEYPDDDGEPMADNTLQFKWIVLIKENLEILFHDDPNVFVAGNLLWYPVEGEPTIRTAPDAMVAFGRPKGRRGSYKQWEEGNIAPQVVFETLSPGQPPARAGAKIRVLRSIWRRGVLHLRPRRRLARGMAEERRPPGQGQQHVAGSSARDFGSDSSPGQGPTT